MKRRCNVIANQGEEAGDCKGLVAISEDVKVYCVVVVIIGEKRYSRVYWNHEKDSNDAGFMLDMLYCHL